MKRISQGIDFDSMKYVIHTYFKKKKLLVFCDVLFVLFVFVLCHVCPMLLVSLDCPFLIAPSVFSNVYLHALRNCNKHTGF